MWEGKHVLSMSPLPIPLADYNFGIMTDLSGFYWIDKKVFIGFSKSILLTISKANYSI